MSDDVEQLIDALRPFERAAPMALPPWFSLAPLARCSLKR
jgi:hypothetical protein